MKKKFTQSDGTVSVQIYAGISESVPAAAGWYIYCNGRMIMGADQTITTGWGQGGEFTIPRYHNQYARFRGYVFFDSDQAWLLPWNTTKTGVDGDSRIFRAVRLEMVALMKPVITFLNNLKREKDQGEADYQPLNDAVTTAKASSLAEAQTSKIFASPQPAPAPQLPRQGRIQYSEPLDKIKKVKKVLGVRSLKEVGEQTFDYFFDREVEEK